MCLTAGTKPLMMQGKRRFHIRNEIIKDLKEKGLYVEQKDNEMQIPICACVTLSDLDLHR